jgi:hypothetical protein
MTGTSSYLDGGLGLDRLEPASGRIKSHQQWYSPDPVTDQQPEQTAPYAMPGGRADILSGDGNFLYLRDAVYDAAGQPLSHGNPHLLTLTGYLDGSWAHRSYWIFGTKCSISTGCSGRDKNIIAGRLLVFSDATIFGYGRSRVDWSNQLLDGPYRLFAVGRDDGTPRWTARLGIQVRAMVLAGDTLFVAGPDAEANVRGASAESKLLAIAAADGSQLAEYELESMPTFDGMAAARGHLFLALENGSLLCFEGR